MDQCGGLTPDGREAGDGPEGRECTGRCAANVTLVSGAYDRHCRTETTWQNECGIQLCPSRRKAGDTTFVSRPCRWALAIVTDAPPMNELADSNCTLMVAWRSEPRHLAPDSSRAGRAGSRDRKGHLHARGGKTRISAAARTRYERSTQVYRSRTTGWSRRAAMSVLICGIRALAGGREPVPALAPSCGALARASRRTGEFPNCATAGRCACLHAIACNGLFNPGSALASTPRLISRHGLRIIHAHDAHPLSNGDPGGASARAPGLVVSRAMLFPIKSAWKYRDTDRSWRSLATR